ncbi:MAG: hypothetical protein R3A48_11315 [Polyangiales bacterium]
MRGGVPLLMPIAGRLDDDRYALGDRAFAMKQHGFARNLPWSVASRATVDADATRAWDNAARRAVEFTGLPSLGEGEVDLHLLDARATRTTLRRPGLRDVEVSWSDALPVLVVWTLPDKDFVCVEPWSAPGNALKEGRARWVPEGSTAAWSLSFRAAR